MADGKTIITQVPADIGGQPDIYFDKSDFEAAIELKGYTVVWETAIKCPCSVVEMGKGVPQPDCQNCLGTGWVYINPIETKMVLQSMNSNTEYKDWTESKIGNMSVTARVLDRLNFMDKITLNEDEAILSENRVIRKSISDELFIFPSYKALEIKEAFLFETADTKLIRLNKTDYTIDGYNILLSGDFVNEGSIISVRYSYKPQYVVLDIPKDIRSSQIKTEDGVIEKIDLPISAMARRVHDYMDAPDFDGNNVFDNSFDSTE